MASLLKVDGDADTLDGLVAWIEYQESLDVLDAVTASVVVPIVKAAATLKICKAGAPFELTLGTRTIKGDIVRVEMEAEGSHAIRVKLFGLEELHRVRHHRMIAVSEDTKDKIAVAIAKLAKVTLKAEAVDATAEPTVFFGDEALAALKRLADERNYAVHIDKDKLSFRPRGAKGSAAALTLTWPEVLDVKLDQDVSGVVSSVKVTGFDYLKDEAVEGEAKAITAYSGGDSALDARKTIGVLPLVIDAPLGVSVVSEAKERAQAELDRRAERFVRGSMRCINHPEAAPGCELKVTDAPWPFTGPFLVSSVVHHLVPGVRTSTLIHFFSNSLPKA